jgi:Mg2+-importing ATPase
LQIKKKARLSFLFIKRSFEMNFSLFEDYKSASIDKLFADLQSKESGLDQNEAIRRIEAFGHNEISRGKKISPLVKLLSHFKDPLIIILLFAALISELVNQPKNAIIIFSMVILSVVMNFYQEHRSSKAAEKLMEKLAITAMVVRSGVKAELPVKNIVPGDIVLLSAGDIVPADARMIRSDDFFVNESALTGESFPVEKTYLETASEKEKVVFAGTVVVSGYATILIVRTGLHTEYGSIASKIEAPQEINAFEVGIKDFGLLIVKAAIFIVLTILVINIIQGREVIDSLLFSIAVAVGLTPELLPVVMSVNMSKGSIKMAKKGAIVKRLNAIPDFGSMDVLCTDKTGTLTEDRITVVKYVDIYGVTSEHVLRHAYINGYFETGIKSPLEEATLAFKHIDVSGVVKIDEIPYDFFRKRLSVVVEEFGARLMITKGAPEEIIKISTCYLDGKECKRLNDPISEKIKKLYDELSGQGFRVLGVAEKVVPVDEKKVYPKSEEKEMSFCGFVAYYDPPKQSAKDTLKFMKHHGIEVKIVTGDSPLVTKKVCEELNFEIKGILMGEDIDKLDDQALTVKANSINIFARFSPNQKDRVIAALRRGGHVVGYLGDGINDAPSMKTADVGISVSNAVDVAKETADVILMHKSLKELIDGVLEGRKTFGNTMKYLMMGISSNFGNMFSMIAATLMLPFFPMLPVQILFNNFLYDFSQMTIPTDHTDSEYLRKPKHWNTRFIKYFMLVFGPISSIFDITTFVLLYYVFHLNEGMFQTGWFLESLATQVLVIFVIRTKLVPFFRSRPSIYLASAALGAVFVGLIFAVTPLGQYFGFSPLPIKIVGVIFLLVGIYLGMVEGAKIFFYKKFSI